jgi:hypothetical protein
MINKTYILYHNLNILIFNFYLFYELAVVKLGDFDI